MRTVRDIPQLKNIPVLLRASLNVPVEGGAVANTFRLRKALPTIQFLQKAGARVVLLGHLGEKGTETFEPVWKAMQEFIPDIAFCPYSVGAEARAAVRDLPAGGVLMLENLRRHSGEVKNDPDFAKQLAELGDVFVEDAFDVCHRSHASVVGIPQILPAYAGLLVEEEVLELTQALAPQSPSLAIIGGAKFSTKEPVLTKLLETYDRVFVGGALANDFMARKNFPIGASLVSKDADYEELDLLIKNPKLMLPIDEVVADPLQQNEVSSHVMTVGVDGVPSGKAILDDGPATVAALADFIRTAKTVLWNGPVGNYEQGYTEGTEGIARAIAASSAFSILGGGDTVAAVENAHLSEKFSFISTGGGAMLDFLAKGTLPGLAVLDR